MQHEMRKSSSFLWC